MSTEKNILQIIELIRRDDSIDAPSDSIRWASNLFRTRATQPRSNLLQKIAAVLQVEIAPNKPVLGERSASVSQVRQMLFRAGDNAIDLRIEPQQKAFGIRGQILGEGFAGATVRIFNDSRSFETSANEMSEFAFDAVPPAEYQMSIQGEHYEVTLKSIDVS